MHLAKMEGLSAEPAAAVGSGSFQARQVRRDQARRSIVVVPGTIPAEECLFGPHWTRS
jgi:hypothetical protein